MTTRAEVDTPVVQSRILRVLQLIILLSHDACTMTDICLHLDVTDRTVYRYFILIQALGFKIQEEKRKVGASRFRIEAWPEELNKSKLIVAA